VSGFIKPLHNGVNTLLPRNARIPIDITFTPSSGSTGTHTANLIVKSNGTPETLTISSTAIIKMAGDTNGNDSDGIGANDDKGGGGGGLLGVILLLLLALKTMTTMLPAGFYRKPDNKHVTTTPAVLRSCRHKLCTCTPYLH